MNKGIIGIVIVLLVLVSGIYYGYYYFTTGVVNVYVQDPPTTQGYKIYLTISSIMLHKVNASNDSWITISNKTITILLTSNMTFLASSRIPSGEYNEIFLEGYLRLKFNLEISISQRKYLAEYLKYIL